MAADVADGHAAAAYGDEEEWDDEELEEYMDDNGEMQVRKKKREKKEKFNNALSKKLKNKLALLDDLSDSDDAMEADDDMLVITKVDEKAMKAEMANALKQAKKNENASKLLKKNLGIDIKDTDDEKIKETLAAADGDIGDGAAELEAEEINASLRSAMPDYNKMDKKELATNIEASWKDIEELKKDQSKLKQQQQNVVDHLVDTNAWLFNALNEILDSKV